MIIIMGLLDSIKKIQGMAEQAKNIAAQLKDAAGALNSNSEYEATPVPIEEDSEPEVLAPDSSGQIVINSVNQMASWLNSLPAKNTTAVALKVMESQMQVIQFVRTPSLLGMVLDNMIATLYQTLKQTTSAQEKETTREIMSAMIQNLIFFADAQLHYMIDQNKQEAKRLLSQAGDMLAKSVANVAVFTAGPAAVADVVLKNIFDSEEVQNGFFGKLIGWISDRKLVEEKKRDFDQTLQNMFETFDRYSSLLGTSIQIHGMLSRYEKQVMASYSRPKYDNLFTQFVNDINQDSMDDYDDTESYHKFNSLLAPLGLNKNNMRSGDFDLISAVDSVYGISKTINRFTGNMKHKDKFNYDYLSQTYETFKPDIFNYANQIEDLKQKIEALSFIQMSQKGKLKEQMEKAQEELECCKKISKKIEYYLASARPIHDDIQAYAAHLSQVTEKYSVSFDSQTITTPVENNPARQMFDTMFAMALSDGVITEEEIEILRPYAVSAGISEGEFKLMVLNKTNFK